MCVLRARAQPVLMSRRRVQILSRCHGDTVSFQRREAAWFPEGTEQRHSHTQQQIILSALWTFCLRLSSVPFLSFNSQLLPSGPHRASICYCFLAPVLCPPCLIRTVIILRPESPSWLGARGTRVEGLKDGRWWLQLPLILSTASSVGLSCAACDAPPRPSISISARGRGDEGLLERLSSVSAAGTSL